MAAVILRHRHHADGAAELDELLVGVGGDRQIEGLTLLTADVGSKGRGAQRGGDSHAFLDVVDGLRPHRWVLRGHLPAELEVDELHADRVRRGADALPYATVRSSRWLMMISS